ncbi:hypothetical protein [Paraburkholderia sp.]|uniref:hypothetical protein n=1 Tax=Paraburkholderia sp. TaxID=1926495 RepID=UPI003D6E59C6
MKTAMRMLACFAAVMGGAASSLVTGATGNDSPAVATGEIVVMHNGPEPPVEQSHTTRTPDDPQWPPRTATVALGEARLDAMRGGFDLPSGLKVSFGISRVAYVNGNLVTTTSVNIPDVSAITAQQAQALIAANAGALVQVGHGNVVQAGALPALTGSVLQNSLNNQQIQAMTTIDTSVNSLSMFKGMNVMSTLTGALANAVHPH